MSLDHGRVLGVAAGAFVATNLDDIMILTVFFAEAQASAQIAGGLKASQVVVGQYLGFTVLVIVSMVGYVVGHFVAPKWIGLLGFVPIFIGVKSYVKMCLCPEKEADDGCVDEAHQSSRDAENGEMGASRNGNTPVQSSRPINREEGDQGDQGGNTHNQASVVSADEPFQPQAAVRALKRVMNPGVLRVGLLTVANGADNLAIYTPLFAASHRWRICVTLFVFYVMVGIWCLFGWGFVRIPIVARAITSYGDRAVPLLLIGLGVYILLDNDSQTVFGAKPIQW